MYFICGICVTIAALFVVVALRLSAFSARYERLRKLYGEETPRTIFMHDHFVGSEELKERLAVARDVYQRLRNDDREARILVDVGQLDGAWRAIAYDHDVALVKLGVATGDVHVCLGKTGCGAADTYEEVKLACEWLERHGEHSVFVVTSVLQAYAAFYMFISRGVWPVLRTSEFLEYRTWYATGKLLQGFLVLVDPYGRNPLSMFIRWRRRHWKNEP